MKYYNKIIMAAICTCILILIAGCSSSVLVDVWNDPSYNEPPLKKILVIAIRKDPIQRRIWEDAFVAEFSKQGIVATTSYSLFPEVLPDTDQVAATVQANGFDGILVSSHLLAVTKTRYVQSYVTSEIKSRYNPFKNAYATYYQDVEHPSSVDSLLIVRRAIDVWDVRNGGKMIWGATSNTPELNTKEIVQNDIANLVIAELLLDAIIIKSEKSK
jgi:hypothetical protein